MMKYHKIHSHWRLSFPERFLRGMPEVRQVQWLFWEGSFAFSEVTIHGVDAIEAELERYVQATRPYPVPLLAADRAWRSARSLPRRASGRLQRELAALKERG